MSIFDRSVWLANNVTIVPDQNPSKSATWPDRLSEN